jgi:hypothetical protein
MKKRPVNMRFVLAGLVVMFLANTLLQRRHNRKLYADFKEETCLRYVQPQAFTALSSQDFEDTSSDIAIVVYSVRAWLQTH